MTGPDHKDTVLSDYAAIFKALMPQAHGFICHDNRGQIFWSEYAASAAPAFDEAYRQMLRDLLAGEPVAADGHRIPLGGDFAYMVRLQGEAGRCLGVLTLLADRGNTNMSYQALVDLLAPAWRSLQRELALRFRVRDNLRKLQVQADEERLLHKIEQILHTGQPCEDVLTEMLRLCHEHLGITGCLLLLPDKGIALTQGGSFSRMEASLLGQDLLAEATALAASANGVKTRPDLLWVPICSHGRDSPGVLAFCDWKSSGFSERRLARVARYVGSHIESLLDINYDALTGLKAWPLLENEIMSAVEEAGQEEHCAMVLNIDQLHVANDTLGRDAGDEVLAKFAAVLREVLSGHPVSRINGDSFAALLRNTGTEKARLLAEDIRSRCREYICQRGEQSFRTSVSIGIGPVAGSGESGGGLASAQVACKAAKDRGRGRVEVYESADQSIIRRMDDIHRVGYVRSAIENDRLALVAQPLLALKTGRVASYHEVLVRIIDDNGQHVPPGEFMSAAERYQLMEELDRWVVSTTLRLLAEKGRSLKGEKCRFAINLSGQSLGSDSFLAFVEEAMKDCPVEPGVITFEITESVAVAKMQQAQNFMHSLKKIGCKFSLDDFGTGLSSFAYLKLFPVDTLKIDGSFVRDLTTNVVSQSVVAAIAEVARVMHLETVAEYVQDQESIDLLRNLNISYAQGYFVGETELLETVIAATGKAAPGAARSSRSVVR